MTRWSPLVLVLIVLTMLPLRAWPDENLLFKAEVGFPSNRISWVHLPDFYSQPHSESGIDLDSDGIIDLLVFLPEFKTDEVRAFSNDGSPAWEYRVDRTDQPKRELGAFALAAFDVDSDGIKEVICGTNDLKLYALDASSGQVKKETQLKYGCYVYSMTLGDVTGDGYPELIVACAGNADWERGHIRILPKSRGYIHAIGENLEPLWHEPVGDAGVIFAHYVFAGDLDGDGGEEVMIPDLSGNFYLVDDSGSLLWAKNAKEIAPERQPSHVDHALITDVDGIPENGNELVVAAQESGCCLYNSDGQILWRTGKDISHGQHCAAADVRSHERGKEILFFDKTGEKVLLYASNGKKLWERRVGYNIAMGGFIDWTGDGTKEIVAVAGEHILIFDEYGRLMESMGAPSLLNHDGMVANVAGDQREEYIAVAEEEFFVFSNPMPIMKEDAVTDVEGDEGDEREEPNSSIETDTSGSPILLQNFPNPFSTGTYIPYIPSTGRSNVEVSIYDSSGRLVKTLSVGGQEPEFSTDNLGKAAYWDGRNETGEDVVYGTYFYSMEGSRSLRKMLKLVD
jgi:outer membrane protein assembly factor BamB